MCIRDSESIYPALRDKLAAKTQELVVGDPLDEKTFIGPIISLKEAERIESWIDSAVKKGAKLVCGGKRNGVMITPALLEDVPHSEPLYCDEAFGPVALLSRFSDFDRALDEVNEGH